MLVYHVWIIAIFGLFCQTRGIVMKFSWRAVLAALCNILGGLGWLYFGCYRVLRGPVKTVVTALMDGSLTVGTFLTAAVAAFFYLSIAGGVWCIGYMLKYYFSKQ